MSLQRNIAAEYDFFNGLLVSVGLPVSANAINKDVGVHTKVSLNVRHRVVSPARPVPKLSPFEIDHKSAA